MLVSAVASALLYTTAISEEGARLRETVQSQASMIEVMARRESAIDPATAQQRVLALMRDADAEYTAASRTGETAVAKREGDFIVFPLQHHDAALGDIPSVPFDSKLAQPMRLALQNQSGSMVGLDYRGIRVLAAYEPVA